MIELTQSTILLTTCLLFMSILWWVQYRNQQQYLRDQLKQLQDLGSEHAFQKQQVELQAAELTQQSIEQSALSERVKLTDIQLRNLENVLIQKDQNIDQLGAELADSKLNISKLELTLTQERKDSINKLQFLEEAKQNLANEFKVLANQIFEEKSKSFNEKSINSLDEVLKPMREQLGDFRKRVDEIHTDETKERASLKEHLSQLKELNLQMSSDAVNLTQALKGENKTQGNWGEMILERILESSGLREGQEFAREQSFNNDEGKRLRPDVVIYMPGDKQVIIDSKVSLTDYERLVSADNDTERKVAMSAHLRSLKSHIQGLSAKRYDHLPNVHSPDYVLMFMPIEGAYLMAIEEDSTIFESAFEQRVAVVTPSTLYATLKLIEQLWRYERQSENVVKLIDRASKLHDKVVDFVKAFEEVGARLDQAQGAYSTALDRMKSGRGNVINQIATLGVLAGKTKKELPKHLTETASLQDQLELSK
ncbi:MAG: DNA recombination protein RmuC [Mariprofundaceae bacterium]